MRYCRVLALGAVASHGFGTKVRQENIDLHRRNRLEHDGFSVLSAREYLEREAVRDGVTTHTHERHVKVERVNVAPELSSGRPARERCTYDIENGRQQLLPLCRALKIFTPVQVLVIDEVQPLRIFSKVIPDRVRKGAYRVGWLKGRQLESAFAGHDVRIT